MINGQSIETAQVKCLGPRKQTRHLVEKDRQESSPGTPLGVTRDRLHAGWDKPSPGTPLEVTRRQATCRTGQAFPWHPSRGNQGTD